MEPPKHGELSLRDLEMVAALVDGSLKPDERAALLERMADDDALREIYAEALRLHEPRTLAEVQDNQERTTDDGDDPGGPRTPGGRSPDSDSKPDEPPPIAKVLRPDPSRWQGWTPLRIIAGVTAAGLAAAAAGLVLLPDFDQPDLTAGLLKHERDNGGPGADTGWWAPPWQVFRSPPPAFSQNPASDFRLGIRMVDFATLLKMPRSPIRDRTVLSDLPSHTAGLLGVKEEVEAVSVRLQGEEGVSDRELRKLYKRLRSRAQAQMGSGEDQSPYYRLGRWAEATRLATLAALAEPNFQLVAEAGLGEEGLQIQELPLEPRIAEHQKDVVTLLEPPPASEADLQSLYKELYDLFHDPKLDPASER